MSVTVIDGKMTVTAPKKLSGAEGRALGLLPAFAEGKWYWNGRKRIAPSTAERLVERGLAVIRGGVLYAAGEESEQVRITLDLTHEQWVDLATAAKAADLTVPEIVIQRCFGE